MPSNSNYNIIKFVMFILRKNLMKTMCLIDCWILNVQGQIFHEYSEQEQFSSTIYKIIQKWERNGITMAMTIDRHWKSVGSWIGTENLDFKKNLNKRSLICRECKTLSKQSTYYDPWSGILYYNLRMFPIERAPLSIDFLNEIHNKKLQKGRVFWTF